MLSVVKEAAVVLSVMIVVGGCGCPRDIKMCQMGIAIWALWKTPAISASAEDVTACRRVRHSMRMGPDGLGMDGVVEPREK